MGSVRGVWTDPEGSRGLCRVVCFYRRTRFYDRKGGGERVGVMYQERRGRPSGHPRFGDHLVSCTLNTAVITYRTKESKESETTRPHVRPSEYT